MHIPVLKKVVEVFLPGHSKYAFPKICMMNAVFNSAKIAIIS